MSRLSDTPPQSSPLCMPRGIVVDAKGLVQLSECGYQRADCHRVLAQVDRAEQCTPEDLRRHSKTTKVSKKLLLACCAS